MKCSVFELVHQLILSGVSTGRPSKIYYLLALKGFTTMFNYTIGDHPELQFEADNAIGGSFPCTCGCNVQVFGDVSKVYALREVITLEERRLKVENKISETILFQKDSMNTF